MTDLKQFAEPKNLDGQSATLTATTAGSIQPSNVNPSATARRPTSASIGSFQPLRPRMMTLPSLPMIPHLPMPPSGTMNLESLSFGRTNPYQASAGFLRSPVEDKKRGRKARRKRTTPAQLEELLRVFEANDNPSHDVREMLSKKVGMTNREVQVWFQNRRAKETNMEKKHEQGDHKSRRSSDSPSVEAQHDQTNEGSNKFTANKFQPIQAAPYPPSLPVYTYGNAGASQFSPFRRMSLGITSDGRSLFFPDPNPPPANAQQFIQQPQPIFTPQMSASFLPNTGAPMQAFPGAPQMMLVPVFASPHGFVPASGSAFAYSPAPPTYNGSATGSSANELEGDSRRASLMQWPDDTESPVATKLETEVPKRRGADALNALASAASEQSLAESL